jgi:hypothetical protein
MKSRNRKARRLFRFSFFLLSDIDRNKVLHDEFDFELTLADGLTVLALQGQFLPSGESLT